MKQTPVNPSGKGVYLAFINRLYTKMKKTRIAFVVLLLLTSGLLLCAVLHPTQKSEKRKAIMQLLVSCIESVHFKPVDVNDSLSDRIYKLYLKRLNRDKLFFTQDDINKFKPYEFRLDSEITQGTFKFFDLVNQTFDERLAEDSVYARMVLSKPFDFTSNEDIQLDYEKIPFPKNIAELHERWRKIIKYEVLTKLAEMIDEQDQAKNKKDTAWKMKTYAEMEKDARAKVRKIYQDYFKDFTTITEDDKETEFFDVIANCFDPHTEYFAPEERKNFEISMSGQLEGIGAQLRDKNGNITVEKVIPGSPAWKSGDIKEGDIFLKVAQGNSEPVDIEGMKLDKAVQLIRGKKGTEVKLTVKSGTTTKVVTLVRDVIHLEDTYARAAVIQNNGEKMGYIRLPEFYTDFDGGGGRKCSEDVKILVKELEKEKVKGIIIDLRDNGGGSLQDVVKMAGLFVTVGPIVQIENREGNTKTLKSEDTAVLYKGPLLVLVNGGSASASEIFAAAMQDYKRGVIMGSQTYGKGTVQQILSLDAPAYANLKPLGSVKVTINKFYRINGGTTQKDGVIPDVLMPDPYQYVYEKEKDAEYPLAWDKIKPAYYKEWYYPADLGTLSYLSSNRTSNDSVFNLIREEARNFKKERDSSVSSLNLEQYRKEEKLRTATNKRYAALGKPLPFEGVFVIDGPTMHTKDTNVDNNIVFAAQPSFDNGFAGYSGKYGVLIYSTAAERQGMKADTNEARAEKLWLKRLTRDPELYEATRVMGDMKQ